MQLDEQMVGTVHTIFGAVAHRAVPLAVRVVGEVADLGLVPLGHQLLAAAAEECAAPEAVGAELAAELVQVVRFLGKDDGLVRFPSPDDLLSEAAEPGPTLVG
ncbi:hypothetical protein OG920_33360 [Streptomyces europaeiscabiei]|uniref:hypothetical protein n=1 Tax=Streptomyces europaeiscabiei TaxID=146819 RepID=UPI0030E0904C